MKRRGIIGRLTNRMGASIHTRGLILWSAALATGIVCVWQHVSAARTASEIDDLKARREELRAEIGFLEMRCSELSSRARIEEYAAEHLGMRYPRENEVVVIGSGGTSLEARTIDLVEGERVESTDG
ncbi:MAG: cell division protein FtsL [Candidatus Eisenbacteria bacterium]|nr:cell division protein FtsL [Candidatus Eisenbacteria bacterium]